MVMVFPRAGLNYYMDGYEKDLLDVYKDAVHNHDTSVVIIFDGRSGLGKTTKSNQVGAYLDPNFSLDNIFYDPNEFMIGLAKAQPGSYLSFDEALLISSRSALSEINKMIIQAMSMIRSKKLFVSFCVNSIFDIDRNLALHRCDALFHIYSESLIQRGKFCAFFKAKDGQDRLKQLYLYGKKYYSYTRPKANFYGTFPKEFVVDKEEYERRKQIGVNKFLFGREKTQRSQKIRDILIARVCKDKFYTPKQISEITGLTDSGIYAILQKAEQNNEKVE